MIELRHLRYFIAVAEELNFKRAAERVHIDQAHLSRAIRDLEDRIGLRLFVRAPRQLKLTPAGAALLKEASEVLIRIERAYRVVRETDMRFKAPLRVGVADGISQPALTEAFIRWRSHEPSVPLELAEMRASELAAALEREEVDVGFSFGLPLSPELVQLPAWSYQAMAILPSNHELASQSVLSFRELLAFPFLSFHALRQPGLSKQISEMAGRYSLGITIAGEACTIDGYFTRIAAGLGVGLADAGHLGMLRREDLAVVALAESEQITTFVMHKRQRAGLPVPLQEFFASASAL